MKHVFLIGFMGSGKSFVGPVLADKLGVQFVDTDNLIETEEGTSIAEMFRRFGEEYFRSRETEVLYNVTKLEPSVVATGGGIVTKPENVRIMRECGTIIYLSADVSVLYERVKHSETRPLILCDNPYERFSNLFLQRLSLYENAATYTIDTTNLSLDEIVCDICRLLGTEVK